MGRPLATEQVEPVGPLRGRAWLGAMLEALRSQRHGGDDLPIARWDALDDLDLSEVEKTEAWWQWWREYRDGGRDG